MKYFILILISLLFYNCSDSKIAEIKLDKDTVDFNSIKKGKTIKIPFRFKNTGRGELMIESVDASCGCTKVEFSKRSFLPNEDGEILITYDSSNDSAMVERYIVIESNTKPILHTLTVKGYVKVI